LVYDWAVDRSINKATKNLYYATVSAVGAAIAIGMSSYVVDMLLCRFNATKNMEQPEEDYKGKLFSEEQDLQLMIDENQLENNQQTEHQDN